MKTKKIAQIMLSALLVFSLAACSMDGAGSKPVTPSSKPADASAAGNNNEEQFHIGYAAPGLSSEYNMMIHDNLVAQCDERNFKLDILSCEGDVSLQVNQIENFITMGVDAIITYPIDAAALTDSLKKARAQGIRVVVNDVMNMDPEAYDVAMSASGFDMGDVACKMAAQWIDKTFPDAAPGTVKVAVFGFWFNENFGTRCDVMKDIAKYNDKATVVEVFDPGIDNYTTQVPEYANILVQKHPDISAILSFTDTFAVMIDEVLYQKGLDYSKIGQFTVDRTAECFNRIEKSADNKSTIRGTAVPGLNAVQDMIDGALGNLDGKLDDKKIYAVETLPVTADNVAQYK